MIHHGAVDHLPVFSRPGAAYAANAAPSRGRLVPEPCSPTRTAFQRDRDRVLHSTAFRRLKHKTQVFVYHEGDHYRTRLTHTLEVSQIARSIARSLQLDEDLAEVLALAHDLGHPPYGHAGERELNACLKNHGGFDHNAQSLRLVTDLERRYAAYDGLNLTWETLEGLVKHNGPLMDQDGNGIGVYAAGVPDAIIDYNRRHDLELWSFASGEAQAAALADDIAYNAHDIDDGLRAGLFSLDDVCAVPLLAGMCADIRTLWPSLESYRFAHELVRRVITRFVEDVIAESHRRIKALNPQKPEDIRYASAPVIAFSAEMAAHEKQIKAFLMARMYRHDNVMRVTNEARQVVRDLFAYYVAHPDAMPVEWVHGLGNLDKRGKALRVGDFIAGMTDRYALQEHRRLFDDSPQLR
jgi:dGTPase